MSTGPITIPTARGLSAVIVLDFLAIPTLLIFGFYFLALDAFLLLLIIIKLFSPGH